MNETSARPVNRIAILGISGSGKSVFSRELARRTGLPLYHMDSLYWDKNWTERPEAVWRAEEKDILEQERWIVEGYIDPSCPERVKAADIVVYLDLSGLACAKNGLKRWWTHRHEQRPELPVGCRDRLDLNFLWVMLTRKESADIENVIHDTNPQNIRRLTSRKETETWLETFASQRLCG